MSAASSVGATPSRSRVRGPGAGLVMSDAQFDAIRALALETAGIALSSTKRAMVVGRLSRRLRELEIRDFDAYLARLQGPQGAGEIADLLSCLTTNVTGFFREPHHFEDLQHVLQTLWDGGQRRFRIWSAGCATGQEPYSIAAAALAVLGGRAACDLKILATDIDHAALAVASAGRYAAGLLDSAPQAIRHWFVIGPEEACVQPALRAVVRFRALNLIEPWPMQGPFDAIFCRNVTIYFQTETQNDIHRRATAFLAPQGRLYLGHAETADAAMLGLRRVGRTTYAKTGGCDAPNEMEGQS